MFLLQGSFKKNILNVSLLLQKKYIFGEVYYSRISVLFSELQIQNLTDMFSKLGHQAEDFIYKLVESLNDTT